MSIILPQAMRVAVPAGGNDFVGMVKDTSLVGVIGIFELYRTGQELVSDTFLPFEVWTGIAIIYIAIVFMIDILVRLDRTPAASRFARPWPARPAAQRGDRRRRATSHGAGSALPHHDPNQPSNAMKEDTVRNTNTRRTARGLGLVVALAAAGWRSAPCRSSAGAEPSRHVRRRTSSRARCSTRSSNEASCASA